MQRQIIKMKEKEERKGEKCKYCDDVKKGATNKYSQKIRNDKIKGK
jgi:hypothetical protein